MNDMAAPIFAFQTPTYAQDLFDEVVGDDNRSWSSFSYSVIPREDIGVYLTALNGKAECFVSANHELIRILARQSKAFECLSPSAFVEKYLK